MSAPGYVYMAYDEDGILLYVGCTINLEERIATHRRGEGRSIWYPYLSRLDIAGPFPRDEAFRLEADAIESLRPFFNATKASIKQHGKWTRAYLRRRTAFRESLGIKAFGTAPTSIASAAEQSGRRHADELYGPRQDVEWRHGQYLAAVPAEITRGAA